MTSYNLVVKFLGLVLLILVVGIIAIVLLDRTVPDALVNLAVADLGGLTGILARPQDSNNGQGQPEDEAQERLF